MVELPVARRMYSSCQRLCCSRTLFRIMLWHPTTWQMPRKFVWTLWNKCLLRGMKHVLLMVIPENMQALHVVTGSNGMWLPLTVQRKCWSWNSNYLCWQERLSHFIMMIKNCNPSCKLWSWKLTANFNWPSNRKVAPYWFRTGKRMKRKWELICLPISKMIHIVYISQSAMTDIHLRM